LQTRLNYHQGAVVFEPEHDVEVAAVPVDVNETTVVRLVLEKPLTPQGQLTLNRWYAEETAVKSSGKAASFEVKIENLQAVKFAKLIIGVHRGGGVSEPLTVKLNGIPVKVDLGDAQEFTEFFAPIDANVPVSNLSESNSIEVVAQENATITSIQILTHSDGGE